MARYFNIFILYVFYYISPSSDARDVILVSFDASHRGDSNELLIDFLRSLDGEIFTFSSFLSFGVLYYVINSENDRQINVIK